MELLKRDLVKLANHLDQIGHRDLADRIDATLTKKAGWRDYTPDFLETSVDYWADSSLADAGSDLAEAAGYTLSGTGEVLGAGVDVATDALTYPAQLGADVYDTVMGGMALTDEEAYERQKRIDNRDFGTDLGDFDKGMDELGRGIGLGVGQVGEILGTPFYGMATEGAAAASALAEQVMREVAPYMPVTRGELDRRLREQGFRDAKQRQEIIAETETLLADMRQAEDDRQVQMEADRSSELQASQTAQDEAGSGRSLAPMQPKDWGNHYYPGADRTIVRAIQDKLGLTQDGVFGPRTMQRWNEQVDRPLPATAQDALDMANTVIASMKEDRLQKTASLEDKMTMLSNAFTSGVPRNVRR